MTLRLRASAVSVAVGAVAVAVGGCVPTAATAEGREIQGECE